MKWWLAALVCLGCLGVAGCQTTSTLQDRSKMMQPGGLVESKPATPKDATGLREGQLAADARAAGRQDADILSSMDARDMAFNRRLAQIPGQSGGPGAGGRSEARAGAKAEAAETMEVSFDFFDADIADVVRLFMELLQENYSLDPAVKGKVALHVTAKMTRDEVWELFRGVLRFHAASTVLDGEVWRILPLAAVPSAIDEAGILFAGDGRPRAGPARAECRGESCVFRSGRPSSALLSPGSMVFGHEQSGVVLVADTPHPAQDREAVQVFGRHAPSRGCTCASFPKVRQGRGYDQGTRRIVAVDHDQAAGREASSIWPGPG
jgi:general secretion pathway protein D